MRIVTRLGLILHMRGRNRDPARFLLRRIVNVIKRLDLATKPLGQHLGDRRRQRRLAMIHMAYRADIHMRLRPLEFFLCHLEYPR